MPKISVQVLAFDNQRFFEPCIKYLLPFVDQIVILYSEFPWDYNPTASLKYKNNLDIAIINKYVNNPKINVINKHWKNEEMQRNDALNFARETGMDFMLVVDPDEFYFEHDLRDNIEQMVKNPSFDYYRNPWHLYWKTDEYRILFRNPDNGKISDTNFSPCFAINLKREVYFENKRLPNTRNFKILDGVCHHMSYVFSDDEMKRKIDTWGHHLDAMDLNAWYKLKWLGWKPTTRNISIINPMAWPKAQKVSLNSKLSEVFGFTIPEHVYVPANPFFEILYDFKAFIKFLLKKIRISLSKFKVSNTH